MSRVDTHDGLYWLVGALAAMIAALLVFGVTERAETETNLPPPAHYQHPEEP